MRPFPPPQRVFILNQKAHYSTRRLTCPFYILQKLRSGTGSRCNYWQARAREREKKKRKVRLQNISNSCATLSMYSCFVVVFSAIPFDFSLLPEQPETRATDDNEASLFWPAALMAIFCCSPKESHSILGFHSAKWPIITMQYVTPLPQISLSPPPLETWIQCFVIKQPLEAAIMHLMYSFVVAEQQWKSEVEKQTGEPNNDVCGKWLSLIEACAVNMTDKLGIVKAFSCGASLLARALFVWAFQLNVVFVVVSVSHADVYPAFTSQTQEFWRMPTTSTAATSSAWLTLTEKH